MRITKRIVTVILLVVVILLGIYCYEEYGKIESPSQPEPPVKHMENTTPVEEKIDFTALTGDINRIIGNERDNYSVFVSRPSSKGEPMIINDKSRRSASMIKVFIMAYAMEQAKNGKLDLATTLTLKDSDKVAGAGIIFGWASGTQLTIEKLITLMITESDNTATNMLIDYLGMDNINAYIVGKGYHGTVLRRKMMDLEAVAAGRENYSSVSDLSKEQADLMLAEAAKADSEYYAMMMPVLIRLALNTGARQGELFALRWSDIDLYERFIDINKALAYAVGKGAVVQEPKTKSSRRKVYITTEDAQMLKVYKKQQQSYADELGDLFDWQDELVFTSQFGRALRPSNFIRRWWKPLLAKCGLPEDINFHQLRHYHASVLLSEGVPIKVVQERLGHATSRMTLEVYAHVMPNTQEKAVEALERYARK